MPIFYIPSFFSIHLDVVSSLVFNLEDNLPDELVSSGNSWGEKGKIYLFDSFKCKHKICSSSTFTILSLDNFILIEIFVENFLFDLAQVGPSGNNQQINGEDAGVPNVVLHRQMHQQQMHQQQLQLLQQVIINRNCTTPEKNQRDKNHFFLCSGQ